MTEDVHHRDVAFLSNLEATRKAIEKQGFLNGELRPCGTGAVCAVFTTKIAGKTIAVKRPHPYIFSLPRESPLPSWSSLEGASIRSFFQNFILQSEIPHRFLFCSLALCTGPLSATEGGEGWTAYVAEEALKRSVETVLHEGGREDGLGAYEALRVLLKVAMGVVECFRRGVVHNDIKPDNVMMTDDGDVRLIDFGESLLDMDMESDWEDVHKGNAQTK